LIQFRLCQFIQEETLSLKFSGDAATLILRITEISFMSRSFFEHSRSFFEQSPKHQALSRKISRHLSNNKHLTNSSD